LPNNQNPIQVCKKDKRIYFSTHNLKSGHPIFQHNQMFCLYFCLFYELYSQIISYVNDTSDGLGPPPIQKKTPYMQMDGMNVPVYWQQYIKNSHHKQKNFTDTRLLIFILFQFLFLFYLHDISTVIKNTFVYNCWT
jgi:hypothetical protein